jgi:hypothetical protein
VDFPQFARTSPGFIAQLEVLVGTSVLCLSIVVFLRALKIPWLLSGGKSTRMALLAFPRLRHPASARDHPLLRNIARL